MSAYCVHKRRMKSDLENSFSYTVDIDLTRTVQAVYIAYASIYTKQQQENE